MNQQTFTNEEFELEYWSRRVTWMEGGRMGPDPANNWQIMVNSTNWIKGIGNPECPALYKHSSYRWDSPPTVKTRTPEEKTFTGKEFETEFYSERADWLKGDRTSPDPKTYWECFSPDRKWVKGLGLPTFSSVYDAYRWVPLPPLEIQVTVEEGKDQVSLTFLPRSHKGPLPPGTEYWTVGGNGYVYPLKWDSDVDDLTCMTKGNVYLDKKDAQKVADWFTKVQRL